MQEQSSKVPLFRNTHTHTRGLFQPNIVDIFLFLHKNTFLVLINQGSGNFEIWIGPADDDDIINEPISKKKKCLYHLSRKLMTIGSPITPFK